MDGAGSALVRNAISGTSLEDELASIGVIMFKTGINLIGNDEINLIEINNPATPVFLIEEQITNGNEFYNAIRTRLPLDPPLIGVTLNWDALTDSLWGGIFNLKASYAFIIWKGYMTMEKNDPSNYLTALTVLETIAHTLSNPEYGAGRTTRLSILMSR